MKGIKSVIGILLVLVMLGSVVSPVFAVNVEQKQANFPITTTKMPKITVVPITGVGKNEVLAKALSVKKLKSIMDMLVKKGYKLDLLNAKVGKIIVNNRVADVAVIPMKSKQGEARLIYVSVNGSVKVSAVEALEKVNPKQIIIYRIVNGKIDKYAVQITGDSCTSTCGLICGMSSATICLILCAVVAENPACDLVCSIAMGGICGAACDYWCTGNVNPCDVGCGAFCSGMCSSVCIGITSKLGVPELSYFCEKYACSPACTGACNAVC